MRQQVSRLSQIVAQRVARRGLQTGHRGLRHSLGKHFSRQQGAQGFQQCQFSRSWLAFGFKITAHKIAAHPGVGVVKKLPVEPLKIHGQRNRLAHANVFELLAPGVELKALKITRVAVLELFFYQHPSIKRTPTVGTRPFTRDEGLNEIKLTRLKGL